jgi:hypothetical protein
LYLSKHHYQHHLGTLYEDVFIPASGETGSHFGNSLPAQGFIEITIKDLESMMDMQVAKLASRGLLQVYIYTHIYIYI